VELAAVIQVVYGEMLRQPFFLDARVKSEPITLSFRGASPEAAARVLDEYLKSVHISRVVREGVNVFVPAADSSASPSGEASAAIGSMASSAAAKAGAFVERTGSIDDAEPEVGEVVRLRYRKPEELHKLVSAVCKNVVPGHYCPVPSEVRWPEASTGAVCEQV
jgi:type II secretory pathway component GspD/PulD (secretin)